MTVAEKQQKGYTQLPLLWPPPPPIIEEELGEAFRVTFPIEQRGLGTFFVVDKSFRRLRGRVPRFLFFRL